MSQDTHYIGSFINPISFGEVDFVPFGICSINMTNGTIISFNKYSSEAEQTKAKECLVGIWIILPQDHFMIPGLIDLHTHAPQFRNLGLGLDYGLLEWLEQVTFPEEKSYSPMPDESFQDYYNRIASIYEPMVRYYLRHGTTTCCYFGSLQLEANKVLVDQIVKVGQRALVGKTCMDCNSPPDYVQSVDESISETKEFIDYVRNKDEKLAIPNKILPVVTPRFALTCSREAMKGLGKVAEETKTHIQSHMSENVDEVSTATTLFPECQDYAHIYDSMGLLKPSTILAHCIHMTPEKIKMLAERGVGVAHCPNSNFALNSGMAMVREMIEAGIHVGLGTDVSGGYAVSIMDAMRQAIIASKALYFHDKTYKPLTVPEAFYLATLGGAKALNLGEHLGSFEKDKHFDALIIDMGKCPVPRHKGESLQQSLQRFVFLGDDRWFSKIYVNAQQVYYSR